ncbi:hypothetical protein BB559_005476 [Furculomyces boomerangus]|uniref:Carbamoyl phosphate synthase arginine-specific small chain n=2 Tax=Harpellales TaxID=61421 RepID=A0A2T9Y8J5_9FUNG|nr:hypothetical protein BB559_005476 [Furculomyces boomerangus]PWA00022.1 hypothetical protein BB558_003934 [Smittium angustum]PWA02495.1 hypothetical protein BB558_001324 [Smittium angustum]
MSLLHRSYSKAGLSILKRHLSPQSIKLNFITKASLATTSNTPKTTQSKQSFTYPVQPGELTAHFQLKTGQIFTGGSFGANSASIGEAVFTTSLVGYPESMTDPSYRGQILIFTQPLIGNYGVPKRSRDQFGLLEHFESEQIQCAGIVVSDVATKYSHWNAVESISEWCDRSGIPAITGVDTRALVHLLRGQGSTLSALNVGSSPLEFGGEFQWRDPTAGNLVAQVSIKSPKIYNPTGTVNIGLIDCGAKGNIIRLLCQRNARVTVLPWDYDFIPHLNEFDGLFISNGPGSPSHCTTTVKYLQQAFKVYKKPIFGICMGNQLLGLAGGFQVYKLPYGNRGHNQPVIDLSNKKCVITSQNHGYALDDTKVPPGWERSFTNANDGSNEGIRHSTLPYWSVQFHPEAKGGPLDTNYMIRDFIDNVVAHKEAEWRKAEAELFDNQLGAEESARLQMALQ